MAGSKPKPSALDGDDDFGWSRLFRSALPHRYENPFIGYFNEPYLTEMLGPPSTASTRRRLVILANCASRPAGRSP